MRSIKRKVAVLGLAAVLLAVCALPGAAAVTANEEGAAPSWGRQLIERVIDSIAGWFGVDDGGDGGDDTGIVLDDGILDDPTSTTTECPPGVPNCEGGPDWDPNG